MTTAQKPLTGPLPQKGHPPRRNVYQQDELSPQHKDALFAGSKVCPPPCSAEHSQYREPSKESTNNINHSRCEFTFSDGRRCRNQRASLCVHHASKAARDPGAKGSPDPALEAPELEALCGDLTTATNINRALAQIFLLLAQGRISQKQAVAFGYLSQLLLQTVPGIRSEFVSAFGYRPWQENLTIRLGSSGSAAKGYQPPRKGYPLAAKVYPQDELSPPNKDALFAGNKVELSPLNKVKSKLSPQPNEPAAPPEAPPAGENDHGPAICTPTESTSTKEPEVSTESSHSTLATAMRAPSPDYASLLSRSSDLFDGKYDTTPEGRRQANALVVELELLKPPASKPPKGIRASAIELVKRLRAQESRQSASAVHPSPPRPPATASAPPTNLHQPSASVRPGAASPAAASPASTRLPQPPAADAIISPPPKALAVSPELPAMRLPSPAPSPAAPVPGITLTRTGHTHDWHGPASCSKPSRPDPLPSRADKLQRELRSMSNYRLRHLQHLNSRGF
jgi:hypothetical protein